MDIHYGSRLDTYHRFSNKLLRIYLNIYHIEGSVRPQASEYKKTNIRQSDISEITIRHTIVLR